MAKHLSAHDALSRQWQHLSRTTSMTLRDVAARFLGWLQDNWFRLLVLGLLVWVLLRKDLTLQLSLANSARIVTSSLAAPQAAPGPAPEGTTPLLSVSDEQQQLYVQRFAPVAQAEMRKFGIPASITLAQGLLETNAGTSPLAVQNNNHFGIKCFSRECRKGHCRNFADDSHKDFFRIYPTAWDSFRSHSRLLQGDRYRRLFDLPAGDYRGWAQGLLKAGYATDKRYADKLIAVIEKWNLNRYDS